jgi:predicted aldo/keto reductase-like oxidoreductase
MKKRKFGKHEDYISIVGLGGLSIKDAGQKVSNSLVSYAYDKGVNYFDVAPGYGDAQELMGRSIKQYRNSVFLACKTSSRGFSESLNDLHNSLKMLNTDHFDLYQLHGMKTRDDFERVTAKNGALEALIKAKHQGKIRYIGFSCHSVLVANLLLDYFNFDSILFPVNWALILKSKFGLEILDRCNKTGIAVLAIKAMANTLWEDKDLRGFPNCWYKPLTDKKMIDLAVKFALSEDIVSFLPPGDSNLFRLGLDAALSFKRIDKLEIENLRNLAFKSSPIGSKDEIFLGAKM